MNPYFRYYLPNPLPCVLRESREVESSLRIKNGLKTQLKISNMGKLVETGRPRADTETPLVASMLVSEIKLSASGHSI